jgi:hypothetical protein
MQTKVTTIKNPLTVIAIFAGTAEISGTAVLPLLDASSQATYLWFLMLFPFSLIALFFITLNWNHRVLYAPSDFQDEDNFINILKKQSYKETLESIKEDIDDTNNFENEIEDNKINKQYEDKLPITTKDERLERDKITQNIVRQQMEEYKIAEKLVLEKLEKELNVTIENDMKMEIGNSNFRFDGVIHKGGTLTAIEVKYMRKRNALNSSQWNKIIYHFQELYNSLSDTQKKNFSIIFAVVTDENKETLQEYLQNKFKDFIFPIAIQIYDFDSLVNEIANKS